MTRKSLSAEAVDVVVKTYLTDREKLKTLAAKLCERGNRVLAPATIDGATVFAEFGPGSEIAFDVLRTARSSKEAFFPCSETLFEFRREGRSIEIVPDETPAQPTVLLWCRPCDAASYDMLDRLFAWDYDDEFWQAKRAATTVVSIACDAPDEYCFCSSVGGSPGNKSGADLWLAPAADGIVAEPQTEKGQALVDAFGDLFTEGESELRIADLPATFDLEKVKPWLDDNFQHPFWTDIAYKCLGCGVCAFVCPTCHCFDMADDADLDRGRRLRTWDSCCFKVFALHASGHNPRPTKDGRYRQRMMHKFKYYVEKFDVTACVGCGRCSASCPIDMNICTVATAVAAGPDAENES